MSNLQSQFPVPAGHFGIAPRLKQRSVLFHAVNKSGSLALASVLRDAYEHAGRKSEYMSRYFGIPREEEEAIRRFSEQLDRPCIWIDHNLVGLHAGFPGAACATTLRDPVRRLISCYFWLQTHHPHQVGDLDIIQWVRAKGRHHTLSYQFACHEGIQQKDKLRIQQLDPLEMASKAEAWFDGNVVAFGITEFFEETIMALACELGLPSVGVWRPDTRNKNRPKWTLITEDMRLEIAAAIHYDAEFYQRQRSKFLERYQFLIKSDALSSYRSACENARAEQENYGAGLK